MKRASPTHGGRWLAPTNYDALMTHHTTDNLWFIWRHAEYISTISQVPHVERLQCRLVWWLHNYSDKTDYSPNSRWFQGSSTTLNYQMCTDIAIPDIPSVAHRSNAHQRQNNIIPINVGVTIIVSKGCHSITYTEIASIRNTAILFPPVHQQWGTRGRMRISRCSMWHSLAIYGCIWI